MPPHRVPIQDQDFQRALRGAYDDPWWREFIRMIDQKRSSYMEELVSTMETQREEDRKRGMINELSWVLSLDMAMGNEVKRQKEDTQEELSQRRNGDGIERSATASTGN